MFNAVQDYTLSLIPNKAKRSQGGWLSFNAVCCAHNGESIDTRNRGGIITNPDGGVSYHCFNCQFRTSYVPGRVLSFKYRKFLSWMGADSNEIKRLVIEALRVRDLIQPDQIKDVEEEIKFDPRELPKEARSFAAMATFYMLADEAAVMPPLFCRAVNYVTERHLDVKQYDFYWTPEVEHKLNHRVIIPFTFKGQTVGYTARATTDGIIPKYHSDVPKDFVFNLDQQKKENQFVLVSEGPVDAMSLNGVSVQTNEIRETQADLIENLGQEVIVVPDFDKHVNKQGKTVWPGKKLIQSALQYGWSVSFPVWRETCKDINHAVSKYGKLFTLSAILQAKESNPLKIKLLMKKHD